MATQRSRSRGPLNQGPNRGHLFEDWVMVPAFNNNRDVPPTADYLPFPAYDFPKLAQLTLNLRNQYNNPGNRERWAPLQLPMHDFIYLKGLVTNLKSKLRPEGEQYKQQSNPMNFEMFMLLIIRLKNFTKEQQLREFYKIVTVMENFSQIEECLIARYKHGPELYTLLDILDHTFEEWLYHLLKKTSSLGTYSWNKQFTVYQSVLRERFTQFTSTTGWEGHEARINQCLGILPNVVYQHEQSERALALPNRVKRFYRTLTNQFMYSCHLLRTEIPARFQLTFAFIESLGNLICERRITIKHALTLIALVYPDQAKNTALIMALLHFHCKSLSEIGANEVLQLMIAGYTYKLATDTAESKKKNKKEKAREVTLQEIESLADPEIVKKVRQLYEKESSESKEKEEKKESKKESKEEKKESKEEKKESKEEKKESKKEVKEEKSSNKKSKKQDINENIKEKMVENFGKLSDLTSKYSGPLSKLLSKADKEFFNNVEQQLADTDPVIASALLYVAHTVRKGITIENWNSFARSLTYTLRSSLPGTKPRGPPPKMSPLEMLRTFHVRPAIRGDILLANAPKVYGALGIVFSHGMHKVLNSMDSNESVLTNEEKESIKEKTDEEKKGDSSN